jgi:hypothetical protein
MCEEKTKRGQAAPRIVETRHRRVSQRGIARQKPFVPFQDPSKMPKFVVTLVKRPITSTFTSTCT